MFSCFRRRRLEDDFWDIGSLSLPIMTDIVEISTLRRRGRLFYYPPCQDRSPNQPNAFFRARIPQPSSLCIISVGADDLRQTPHDSSKPSYLSRKLARSRENAKRFLRLSLNQSNFNAPSLHPVALPPRQTLEALSQPASGDMHGDAPRSSMDRGRHRGNSGVGAMLHRPSLADDVRRSSMQSDRSDISTNASIPIADEKPIASGNGVSISIALAEPVLFLQGFDQNDTTSRSTTMLRGSLHLKVTKQAKIKAISLNFKGKSETEWPEGKALSIFFTAWLTFFKVSLLEGPSFATQRLS